MQDAFESRFSDFAEEDDCIIAFINPFSRTEQYILRIPSDYRWNFLIRKQIQYKKMKFD